MACAIRAPRAIRYCAAGFELMPTAMRSRMATARRSLSLSFSCSPRCCSRLWSTAWATWRNASSRKAIKFVSRKKCSNARPTRSCGYTSPRRMRFCNASGVRSIITTSLTLCSTQSGTVSRIQQFQYVFITLAMLAALDVGVRQFVHQRDARLAGENGVHVHLFEERALILDRFTRHHFQIRDKVSDRFPSVGFDNTDHHIFAASVPPDRLGQHGVGL